jgi:type II secretory pathway component GspD/PulD (secretin)
LNKRIRSRVLAASIVSTTLLGTGGLLYPERPVRAQDRPTAVELLDRGGRLYDQKQYGEAKRILTDVDPAQLPENLRARHAELLTRTDQALSQSMGPNAKFDSAEQDRQREQFASAAAKYTEILNDPQAPADVKERARIQLALVQQVQRDRAPQMRELLNQAQALYDQGRLDDAQNALNTVAAVGAPLNWEDTPRLQRLQAAIAERRTAAARGVAAAPGGTIAQATPPANVLDTAVTPPAPAQPLPPQGGNVLDVTPPVPGGPIVVEGGPAQGGSLLEQAAGIEGVRRQRALTLYNEARRLSQEALRASPPQFQQAISRAQEAIDTINANRAYLSDIEASALVDAAQAQLNLATSQQQSWQVAQQAEIDRQTRELEIQRDRDLQSQRKRQVATLVSDANRLVEVSQFQQAADLLRQATVIDPLNTDVKLMLRLVEDKINDRAYEQLQHRRGVETIRQQIDSAEHLIPYADLMVYPDNWVEITRKRVGSEAGQDSAANRAVRARLEEPIREITAEQQGLERVLNFLRDSTSSNIFVNWRALEAAGIDRNSPVTISLREIPFRKALQTILAEVGGGTANLGYTIDDGIITVSTRDDLNSAKYQTVKVFDIRDLLVQPNNRAAPTLNLGQTTSQAGQGSTNSQNSNGQGGLFGNQNNNQNQNQNQNLQQNRQGIVTNITDTIKAVVAPDSWRDNGGTIGSIRELNGQLIVNQTVDNQIEVMNLLQQLRETRAIQIAIEARMLLVSNNFLDDFRIGWNLTFPAGSIANNLGAVNFNNLNSYTNAIPPDTGVPGSIVPLAQTPAFNFAATIIDNWTLNLLLTATQADKRTVSVAAPRVTIFNGQTGFIAVTNQLNFVSNFNQTTAAGGTVGNAATATSLTIGTLTTGVTLQVEATVSSDHRYVVMNVDPQLSTLDGIDTISVGTTGSNTTSGSNSLSAVGGAFVQLPRISNTEVNTMVSVPDEGTLLIGGQKLVGESEIEIGVPVLSKIPGLNRFFTNRAFVKDERTLLVLVRPKIIIHKEIENDLFGPGYDRPTGLPTATGGGAVPTVAPGGM